MNVVRFAPALLLAVLACGGPQDDAKTTTPGGGGGGGSGSAKPTVLGDYTFEIPKTDIKGVIFEPEALGRPGMPLVESKRKVTLEKQRAAFASQKDKVQKEAAAEVLATMLYQKSKDDKAGEKDLLTEARQALRDAAALSGDKVDGITLRMLGSYELLLEDYPGAEKAWAMLVAKAPTDKEVAKDVESFRAWWALTLLKQYKNADALALVKPEPLTDKQPELAYVTAWARLRSGDEAGAWQAILVAAKGWKENPNREILDRDVMLFAARTNVSFADALPQLTALFVTPLNSGRQKAALYALLAKLGLQSYGFAGRWADGVAALDKALTSAGDTVPVEDRPVILYTMADFTVRLDDPAKTAKLAKQSLEALPACGAKCSDKDKGEYVQNIYLGMGRVFHLLYATANDVRYYQPAHDLYAVTIPLLTDEPTHKQAQSDMVALEQTLKNTKVGSGEHNAQSIGVLLSRHNQEVQSCYELQLVANPKLGGSLTLNLESDQTGVIKGASTEPKAGLADLSAVAGCVAEHAKSWKIPKRGKTGSTRIKLTYSLALRK